MHNLQCVYCYFIFAVNITGSPFVRLFVFLLVKVLYHHMLFVCCLFVFTYCCYLYSDIYSGCEPDSCPSLIHGVTNSLFPNILTCFLSFVTGEEKKTHFSSILFSPFPLLMLLTEEKVNLLVLMWNLWPSGSDTVWFLSRLLLSMCWELSQDRVL